MFDNLQGYIWFDGAIIPWSEAKLHVMSHALHYASSVFEGMRAYNSVVFKAKQHYQRLHRSAKYLDFEIIYSPRELIEATNILLKKCSYNHGYIRAISWCGSQQMKISTNNVNVHTAIAIWERPVNYKEEFYTEGIKMNISSWRRPAPDTAPVHSKAAGLYMISSLSKKTSEKLGFNDALMLDYQGYIAEATSSNIFFVIDNKLYTPIADCFLNGITRLTCIDIAKNLGIEIYEAKLSIEHLSKATEVFLTGTAIEILPVGSIMDQENNKIWHFKPSNITYSIMKEFRKLVDNWQED